MAEDIKLVIGTDNPTIVVTTTDKVDIRDAAKSSDINFVATGSSGIKGDTGPQGPPGTGITTEQAAAIEANTAKNSFDSASINKLNNIEANAQVNRALLDEDNMVSDSDTLAPTQQSVKAYVDGQTHLELGTTNTTALAGNTTTISTEQASAITANTNKTGITTSQASAIVANTAKTGITTSQASAITANTAKVGITTSQANAITANTAKPDLTVDGAGTVHPNNYTDTNTQLTQEQVEDFAGDLIENGNKTGISVTYNDANDAIDMVVDHDAATNFVAEEHYRWDNDIQSTATINHLNLSSDAPAETEVLVMNNGDAVWGHGEKIHIQVRNDEGSTIPAGAPLYSKGEIGGSNRILVGVCDANDSAKMPCIGIAHSEMNTTDTKDNFAVVSGIYNTNISGFTSLAVGNNLYVQDNGSLSQTKPTGEASLIQNVAIVLRTNGSICHSMLVSAIGRTNDVPNLNSGYIFYGNGSNQAVSTQLSTLLPPDLTVDGAGTVHANNYTNTTYSIQDGELSQNNFTDADHTKLNGIETNATADQTKADIDALGIAASTATSLTAGDKTISGDLTVTGNDIKDSGGNSIISSDGSGVVTMAGGNIAVGGSNANLNMNSGSDIVLEADNNGGSNTSTIQYPDSGGTNRIILGADSDVAILSNRAANGTVQIRANTSTAGGSGEVTVVTVEDDKVTISQNLDVTGNLTVNGSVNKSFQQFNLSFSDDISNLEHFLSWRDQYETSTNNYTDTIDTNYLVPANGRVKCVYMRVGSRTSTQTMTVKVYSQNAGFQQSQVLQEAEATSINSSDDFEVFAFYFDNAEHFQAGDSIKISVQDSADSGNTQIYHVTAVLEFDYTQMGRTTSGELA